ncbi:MAG: hypothetical protein GX190_01065 [Mollicutes bacterium]|nr:hypothetical protein [Mollicutes bacterium]
MWNKKLVVTNHAKQRFIQRHLNYSKKKNDAIQQILTDLKPLNVMRIEKIHENHMKVTTRQGKVYVLVETDDCCFVKTAYKTNVQYELALKHLTYKEKKNAKNKCKKDN